MTENERQLLKLLTDRSFQRGDFTLASGEKSTYYIDGRTTATYSEGAFLMGQVLYERTRGLSIDAVGGLEVGAVPLMTAAVIAYHLNGRPIEGFWVRDKAKTHGTQKRIEGKLSKDCRVVVVDDVFTKGGSAMKAVEAVREIGCEVVLVLAIVDRLQGARELFAQNGIANYQSVFTIRDFGVEVPG